MSFCVEARSAHHRLAGASIGDRSGDEQVHQNNSDTRELSPKEPDRMKYKSYDWVREKLAEAEFFAEKIAEARGDVFRVRCYFSAFVSAARSVTFALQFVAKGNVDGFEEWYEGRRIKLESDPLARFFVERRNEVQKRGSARIGKHSMTPGVPEENRYKHYFSKLGPGDAFEPISQDVATASNEYLELIRDLVDEFEDKFSESVDPYAFFNLEVLGENDMTIEDVEEALGFPAGWTYGVPPEKRLEMLREASSPDMIQ